ncbi:MAG: hypothetical protein QM775_29920 [Pirellulales bacterium]
MRGRRDDLAVLGAAGRNHAQGPLGKHLQQRIRKQLARHAVSPPEMPEEKSNAENSWCMFYARL